MNAKDVDLLRRSDLFRFLPDEHFEKIRSLLQEERHDFGDLIVKQGEPASAFYILISGRARVVKSGANNGEEIVLGYASPGRQLRRGGANGRRDADSDGSLQHLGRSVATRSGRVPRADRNGSGIERTHAGDATRAHAAEFPLRIQ